MCCSLCMSLFLGKNNPFKKLDVKPVQLHMLNYIPGAGLQFFLKSAV